MNDEELFKRFNELVTELGPDEVSSLLIKQKPKLSFSMVERLVNDSWGKYADKPSSKTKKAMLGVLNGKKAS